MSKAVDNPQCWPQQPVDNRLPPVETTPFHLYWGRSRVTLASVPSTLFASDSATPPYLRLSI